MLRVGQRRSRGRALQGTTHVNISIISIHSVLVHVLICVLAYSLVYRAQSKCTFAHVMGSFRNYLISPLVMYVHMYILTTVHVYEWTVYKDKV